ALIAGWVTTEVGRQPWVVYRVMPTADAVTGAGGIPVGYTVLALSYVLVGLGVVWVLRRLARAPLELDEAARCARRSCRRFRSSSRASASSSAAPRTRCASARLRRASSA